MEKEIAMQEMPKWAQNAVRIIDEDDEPIFQTKRWKHEAPKRSVLDVNLDRIAKRYGILLIGAMLLTLYTIILASWVSGRTEQRVRNEVLTEARRGFRQTLVDHDINPDTFEKNPTAEFVADAKSRQDAIDQLGAVLSEHVAGLRQDRKVTKAGAETYVWVDCARLASGQYGRTIEDVVSDPKKVENYVKGHPVRKEDEEIGYRVAEQYITGQYPDGYTVDMHYAEIRADGSVRARDQYISGPDTNYWWIGK